MKARFDNYEVHGVKEWDGDCEQVPDEEAHFWTLYGHIPDQGLEAIGDFISRKAAEDVMERITGVSITHKPNDDVREKQ